MNDVEYQMMKLELVWRDERKQRRLSHHDLRFYLKLYCGARLIKIEKTQSYESIMKQVYSSSLLRGKKVCLGNI